MVISKYVKEKVLLVSFSVLLLINISFFLTAFSYFIDAISFLIIFFVFTLCLVYFIILSFRFLKQKDEKTFYKLSAYSFWITYFNVFAFLMAVLFEILALIFWGPFMVFLVPSMFIACITFIFLPSFVFSMLFKIFFDFKIAENLKSYNSSVIHN